MAHERMVPYGVLTFVVVAALMLAAVIARSPDTHGHVWRSVPPSYARTPMDTIGEANLPAILAELPPFAFPSMSTGGSAGTMMTAPHAGEEMEHAGATSAAGTEEVQRVELTQSEFAFAPDRLTLKAGVPVELTVTNEGQQVHGIWLPEFRIAEDIRAGKKAVFRFTPDKPGRFRYVCSYNLCGTEEEHARMVGFVTVR